MPRCLMAKKWKSIAYEKSQHEEAQKRLKGDNNGHSHNNNQESVIKGKKGIWGQGPSSPTEGATAPSPPPAWLPAPTAGKVTVLFNGYLQDSPPPSNSSSSSVEDGSSGGNESGVNTPRGQVIVSPTDPPTRHTSVIRTAGKGHTYTITVPQYIYPPTPTTPTSRFSLHNYPEGCIPPPKKRELYRPYCLPESIEAVQQEKRRLQNVCSTLFERKPEDLTTAHAILDLSTSHLNLPPPPPLIPAVTVTVPHPNQHQHQSSPPPPPPLIPSSPAIGSSAAPGINNNCAETLNLNYPLGTVDTNKEKGKEKVKKKKKNSTEKNQAKNSNSSNTPNTPSKTIAYTYEAFFISDGRSKKKKENSGGREREREQGVDVTNGNYDSIILSSDSESTSASIISSGEVTPASSVASTGGGSKEKSRYTCSECGKNYATSSNLSRHKQTHRSLDSQAAKRCPTCGKAYVSMPALAMHILTHNLNHKCDVCGKAFSRPWLLQGHLRSHTGEKPYGCAHCGKAFADRSNLRAHMQTHSSAKNYECKRCHKSFALKSYLNKHYDSACFKEEIEEGEVPSFSRDSDDEGMDEDSEEQIQIDDNDGEEDESHTAPEPEVEVEVEMC